MAFNGSGTFVRIHNWLQDRSNGIKVRADRMDAEDDGFAAGLSNCIARDGQSTISADIPFNNKKITGLADATGSTHAMNRQASDARYQLHPKDLTQETTISDTDEFPFFDASADADRTALFSTLKALLRPPIGGVIDYAGATAPDRWLLCYGQAVSRSTYAALFTAIGTTYGAGDGSTTFNLPDCRGRVVAGEDDMGGSSANRLTNQSGGLNGDVLGATGGAENVTMARADMPNVTLSGTTNNTGAHTHTVGGGQGDTGRGTGSNSAADTSSGTTSSNGAHSHTVTTESINGGVTQTAMNNVQPTIIMNKIIFAGV